MENPEVKLVVPQGEVLKIGLWELIIFHLLSGIIYLNDFDEAKLFLNDEEVKRPIYEAEEV